MRPRPARDGGGQRGQPALGLPSGQIVPSLPRLLMKPHKAAWPVKNFWERLLLSLSRRGMGGMITCLLHAVLRKIFAAAFEVMFFC